MTTMTAKEIELMESSTTANEWNNNCDTIKRAHDGSYPDDWWQTMKLSGRMDKTFAKWKSKPQIHIEVNGERKSYDV